MLYVLAPNHTTFCLLLFSNLTSLITPPDCFSICLLNIFRASNTEGVKEYPASKIMLKIAIVITPNLFVKFDITRPPLRYLCILSQVIHLFCALSASLREYCLSAGGQSHSSPGRFSG